MSKLLPVGLLLNVSIQYRKTSKQDIVTVVLPDDAHGIIHQHVDAVQRSFIKILAPAGLHGSDAKP
jgi:hypothetical protein